MQLATILVFFFTQNYYIHSVNLTGRLACTNETVSGWRSNPRLNWNRSCQTNGRYGSLSVRKLCPSGEHERQERADDKMKMVLERMFNRRNITKLSREYRELLLFYANWLRLLSSLLVLSLLIYANGDNTHVYCHTENNKKASYRELSVSLTVGVCKFHSY